MELINNIIIGSKRLGGRGLDRCGVGGTGRKKKRTHHQKKADRDDFSDYLVPLCLGLGVTRREHVSPRRKYEHKDKGL